MLYVSLKTFYFKKPFDQKVSHFVTGYFELIFYPKKEDIVVVIILQGDIVIALYLTRASLIHTLS